jgi:diguanylate cyclase (GGDEF)-like protein
MKRHDPAHLRQSLQRFLEAHPPQERRFLARFEKLDAAGQPVYSQLLHVLTHLSFAEGEARKHWARVVAHRARLSQALGRDPGLRVAILDYFVNVNQALENPKVIELAIYERTERSAASDGLTGLFNHAYFTEALGRELQRARRHAFSLALVLFDLDDFKHVNDTRGHLAGDRVLARTAAVLKQTVREMDVAARYGGEEFALILPDTERNGCYVVAERIRRLVERRFRRSRKTPGVTLSGGVASFPQDARSAEELIQRADERLYRSKATGKNRITLV